MAKLVRTKLYKQRVNSINVSKSVIRKILYGDDNIPDRLEHTSYLKRDKIEDDHDVIEVITQDSKVGQLASQEYKYKAERLEQNKIDLPQSILIRNRRSDSDSDQLSKNTELFNAIRKRLKEGKSLSEEDRLKEIEECLNNGADINAVDKNNKDNTILHIAVKKRYEKIVEFLLQRPKINTSITNTDDKTAKDLVQDLNNQNIIQLFIKYDKSENLLKRKAEDSIHDTEAKKAKEEDGVIAKTQGNSQKRQSTSAIDIADDTKRIRVDTEKSDYVSRSLGADSTYSKGNTHASDKGLRNSLHGNIYQLKIQMLFLKRAIEKGYAFNLGTEVEDAWKFDDIVFKYKSNVGDKICFVQAKHKQDESKKITANDLLTAKDKDFSLQKYFISYRAINKNKDFSSGRTKDFILYTNIDFDYDDLKKSLIQTENIRESDDIIYIKQSGKSAAHCKLVDIPKDHKLYERLRETSDLHLLAKELAKHIKGKTKLELRSDIFKLYHGQLKEAVFEIEERKEKSQDGKEVTKKYAKFRDNFVHDQNLSEDVSNFRNALKSALGKRNDDCAFKDLLQKTELNTVLNFDKVFKFSKFETCGETTEGQLLLPKDALPNDRIEDIEIENFFKDLTFAVNQPNEVELGEIIKKELVEESKFNLLNADLVAVSFQSEMLSWFKEKRPEKGKEGVWLNKDSGKAFFEKIEKQVNSLISVGLSLARPEKLQGYGVEFQNNDISQKLEDFISPGNTSKNVLHIAAQETTVFSAIKICHTLKKLKGRNGFEQYTKDDSYIFVSLKTLLRPTIQKRVMDAFESEKNHNLLIIDCTTKEDQIQSLDEELFKNVLKKNKDKKIILIASEYHTLASKFSVDVKDTFNDKTSFHDLTQKSQQRLLEKEVIFQGENVSLNKLIDQSDANTKGIMDPGTLFKLMKGEKIIIGSKPLDTSDLEGAYSDIFETVNMQTFIDALSLRQSSDIYIISGLSVITKETTKEKLIEFLSKDIKINQSEGTNIKSQIEVCQGDITGVINNRIQVYDDQFKEKDFRQICLNNSEKKIYWIHLKHQDNVSKFRLEQIYNPNFYLKGKRFNNEVVLEKNIKEQLASNILSEIFIICGTKEIDIIKWFQFTHHNDVQQFKINSQNNKIQFFTAQDDLEATYREIIERDQTQTVHLLKFEQNQLVWDRTHGSLENLSKYRARDHRNIKPLIGEDDLIKEIKNKQVTIIAGDPGIGKSTTLIKLYQLQSSSEEPIINSHWLIRVNLKDHVKAIKKIEFSNNDNRYSKNKKITKFLSQNLGDDFGRSLLGMALVKEDFGKPLLIAFDGFDEVLDQEDRVKIISLLKHLKNKTKAKFWITTRLHYEQALEGALSEFAIKFDQMDDEITNTFITMNLKNRLSLALSHKEFERIFDNGDQITKKTNIQEYIKAFLSKMHKVFKVDVSKFIGTPLQLNLLLEGSATHFKAWVEDSTNAKIPDFTYLGNDIWEVYENFVDRKYGIAFKKEGIKEQERQKKDKSTFDDDHKKLAKSSINLLSKILPQNIVLSCGIVKSDGNNIDFIHQTFREYFIAKILTGWIEKWHKEKIYQYTNFSKQEKLMKILKKPDYQLVRIFLNSQFLKESSKFHNIKFKKKYFDDKVLFVAARESNIGIISFMLDNFEDIGVGVDFNDNNNATVLHYAAQSGNLETVKWLVNDKGANINAKDYADRTVLHYAAQSGNLEIVEFLTNKKGTDINAKDSDHSTVLHYATRSGNLEIVKWLVDKSADISAKDYAGRTVLHYAAQSGNLEIVELLVDKSADINAKDNHGATVLHYAAQYGNLEIVEFLTNKKGTDINAKDSDHSTVLHYAARSGNLEIVKWLVDKSADINAKDYDDRTVLHYAAQSGNLEIVELLVDKSADINAKDNHGATVLHYAAKSGNLETVKWLVNDKSADINAKDNHGTTVLHYAAQSGNLEIVELLVDKSADINAKDNHGATVLHYAAKSGNLETVKWLVNDKSADINAKDNHGTTVLHYAAQSGNLEIVELLVDKSADISAKDYAGRTVLHYAAQSGNLKIVELLVDKSADINAKDYDDRTVLHYAAQYGSSKIVKFLTNKDKEDKKLDTNINAEDNNGVTVLHYAAKSGNLKIVKWLVNNKSADINAKDYDDRTVLHYAAKSGNLKIVELLVDKSADINAKDYDDRTVLHYAAKSGNLKIVKWLVNNKSADINAKDYADRTVLHYAAQSGNLEIVELLVDKSADINAKDNHGATVLHYAAKYGNLKIVELLVDKSADINAKDSYGATVLHYAAQYGNLEIVKWLVNDKSADINAKDSYGATVLHYAAKSGNLEIVKWLVNDKSADINAKGSYGATVLHYAAKSGNLEIVELLVDKSADINAKDSYGATVLHYAAKSGNLEIVKWLVNDKSADINAKGSYGATVLHYAAKSGNLEIVELLVDKSADINAKDSYGATVLHYAVQSGNLEIVELLVDKSADINAKDNHDATVLHYAAQYGNLEIVKWLVNDKSADINAKDNHDATVLHYAAQSGNLEIVEWLVDKSADINAKDNHGATVLHYAVQYGNLEIVEWLVDKSADINAKDNHGATVLHYAVQYGNLEIVKWLVNDKSADINDKVRKIEYSEGVFSCSTSDHSTHYYRKKRSIWSCSEKEEETGKEKVVKTGKWYEVVEWLVNEKGADINSVDEFGRTILHKTAERGNLHAANIGFKNKYGKTALDLARKEQNKEVIDLLQQYDIDSDQKNLAIKIEIDSLKDLRKQKEQIGLEPASGFDINCISEYRAKRHIGSCQENIENLFPYQPLEESVTASKARSAHLYYQTAMVTVLKYSDQFGDVNQNLQNIISYNRYIGDIITEQSINHSPREQKILSDHYLQAQRFLESYPETTLFKPYQAISDAKDQIWLFDNAYQNILVFKEGNRYKLYSQDFNYRQLFQTSKEIKFEELEGFIKLFFKWRSGDSNYEVFTLSDNIPIALIEHLKQAMFWHPEQVAPDSVVLSREHLNLIESIPAFAVKELFLVNGKVPDINALHSDFFKHGNISFRIELLNKILPSLSSDQIKDLLVVIKKYNINYDRTYLDKLSLDERQLLEVYYDKVIGKLSTDSTISSEDLSTLSWSSLYEDLARHPDISPDLAKDIVSSTKEIHRSTSKGAILKGMATQSLFFLPDMIRAYNSGDLSNLEQTGAMIAVDTTINHLYSTFISKLAPVLSPARVELLNKLPVTSPIFKALTIYSIVDLHKQLSKLPADSEQGSVIKHKLGEQYVTAGLMIAELLGFEVTPLWIGLIAEQLIFGAESFRNDNHLDIPFWEAFAMSLGFEQDKLKTIFEERDLVEMNLALVNQINSQSTTPYGLTVVKIPKLGKLKWEDITHDQIPTDIYYNMQETLNFPERCILEGDGFRLVNDYYIISNNFARYGDITRYRGKLKSSVWQKAIYDASPDVANIRFGVYDNHHKFSEEKDNFFLDQGLGNNSNWHRVPVKYKGIQSIAGAMFFPEIIERQTSTLDPVARNNIGFAAVYRNDKVGLQSNCYVLFDSREGDLELEFTKEGLQKINEMNRSLFNSTITIVNGEFISPYVVNVQVGYKMYPASIKFFGSKGTFSLNDASQGIITQYRIADNIDYVIKDFSSATRISFAHVSEQQAICHTIRSEPNTISILKWQCNNNVVQGQNQTTYLNITDIPGTILISDNKKYLQLILNNHVIDSHLRLSAKYVEIIEAQGALSRNSTIDLTIGVVSFNITMRGDITVQDSNTYLELKGVIPTDLPTTVYSKSSINKVISFYDLELEDLDQILGTLIRLNTPASDIVDIKFISKQLEYHWVNKLPQNNTLKLSGSLDGKSALLKIEESCDTLKIFDTPNKAKHTEIIHHNGKASIATGLVLIKIFQGNNTKVSDNSLVENIANVNDIKMFNNKYYDHGEILVFRNFANHLFYHCFAMNDKVKLNDIDYLINGQRICALATDQDMLNGNQLIRYSIKSLLANLSKMIGICFTQSLSSSEVAIHNNSLIINGLMLKDIEDNTKLYFGDTEILEVKVLKDSYTDSFSLSKGNQSLIDQQLSSLNSSIVDSIDYGNNYTDYMEC